MSIIKVIRYFLILSIILAGSTSAIAYLLDPAIDKIFLNKEMENNLIFRRPIKLEIYNQVNLF